MELVADRELNINCAKSSSTPILLLCRNNKSESLYPCLKSILAREDVDLKMTTSQGNNALMLLSRYYPLSNPLIDCIRLLVNHGFDINEKNKDKKPALFLLSQNPSTSKNLIDVARLLINEKSDFKIAHKAAVALQKRGLLRDGEILSKIINSYVLGLGRVNNNVRIPFFLFIFKFLHYFCLTRYVYFLNIERRGVIEVVLFVFLHRAAIETIRRINLGQGGGLELCRQKQPLSSHSVMSPSKERTTSSISLYSIQSLFHRPERPRQRSVERSHFGLLLLSQSTPGRGRSSASRAWNRRQDDHETRI